jgi:uncharacterized iron-regulated membrane protein
MRARRALSLAHRYSGLLIALLAVLAALTGSLLTFAPELDRLLNPELLSPPLPAAGASRRPLAEQIAAAEAKQSNEPDWQAAFIVPAQRDGQSSAIWMRRPDPQKSGSSRFRQVLVNPYTGKVLGQRERSRSDWSRAGFIRSLARLHGDLLLGAAGRWIMGIGALIWVLTSLVGLYLWWPGRQKLALALAIKRGAGRRRLIFDLHRASGFYSAPVLLVVAFTGIYLALPATVRSLVAVVAPLADARSPRAGAPADGAMLDPDQAITVARSVFPDGELRRVSLPSGPNQAYVVAFQRAPDVARTSGGRSVVGIDPYRGDVLSISDGAKAPAGNIFINWQLPLHSGSAFGLPGRVLVFVAGLIATLLAASGLLIWWQRGSATHHRPDLQ